MGLNNPSLWWREWTVVSISSSVAPNTSLTCPMWSPYPSLLPLGRFGDVDPLFLCLEC